MGRNPLVAVTLLGLLFYGFLRVVYITFYGGLGLDPGEVGLGYRETLLRGAALVPLLLALVIAALLAAAIACGSWWALVRFGKLVRLVPRRVRAAPAPRDFFAFATVYGLVASLIAGIVIAAVGVPQDVRLVKRGGEIEAGFFTPYTAEPAQLDWVGSGAPPVIRQAVSEKHRLLYLGKASGVFVLYDTVEDRAIQVPTSVAVLTLGERRTPLSRDEYAAAGNRICDRIEMLFPAPPTGQTIDISALARYFNAVFNLSEFRTGELLKLAPPPDLEPEAHELFAVFEEQRALAREARDAALRGDKDGFGETRQKAATLVAREKSLENVLGWTGCSFDPAGILTSSL